MGVDKPPKWALVPCEPGDNFDLVSVIFNAMLKVNTDIVLLLTKETIIKGSVLC